MRFLITNDDGIFSPGLLALVQAASSLGEVCVYAPGMEQSSAGHAVTASRPVTYRATPLEEYEAYRVDGTPADCVTLGLARTDDIDMVLSGINLGYNLGNSMWHSGTLAGAKQGVLLGIRGVAVSMPPVDRPGGYDYVLGHVTAALEQVLSHPELRLVNINIPLEPGELRWTRQSVRHYDGRLVRGAHPKGKEIYWFVVDPIKEADPDTDRHAVEQGYVSLTPLDLDLTDHAVLKHIVG